MNLKDIFRSRDRPKVEDKLSGAMVFSFGRSKAGQQVTPRTSIAISTVYACVRVIAETVASLPFHVMEVLEDGSGRRAQHDLDFILHSEPNLEMTSFSWRETMMCHLLLWGNSYSQVIRNGRGKVMELYPLLPENMKVDRDDTGNIVYKYTVDGRETQFRQDQIFHVPGLGFDGLVGYSPIAMTQNALGLSLAAEEYGSRFFQNGAAPSGILTTPKSIKFKDKLREQWQNGFSGSNVGKVAILDEDMHYQAISMPNSEAQFLETRRFQVEEICRIYRMPPHMVADLSHATFSNIEHQSISFARDTILPWVNRIEQAADRALLLPKEKGKFYTNLNLDGLMRGDYKSRMEGYAVGRQNGWMSANDIRRLENQTVVPAEEGGDAYLVNGNMISLQAAMNAGAPAAKAGETLETN